MEPKPLLTAEDVKKKLIALHRELGHFQFYLAHRNGIPPMFEGEEHEAVNEVLALVEREVQYQARVIRENRIETAMERSWDHAFPPVQTPPEQPGAPPA